MLGGPQGDREAGPCIVADFNNGFLIRPSGCSIVHLGIGTERKDIAPQDIFIIHSSKSKCSPLPS